MRSTSSTKSNDQSSRSHFLFRLKITGVNEAAEQRTEGELNLVDLAGSERIKDSGVSGKGLEEAKFINKSLTSLGDVISGERAPHPTRVTARAPPRARRRRHARAAATRAPLHAPRTSRARRSAPAHLTPLRTAPDACAAAPRVAAMVSKSKHVPYRNSRLTHLLSNALRGKSKTLMFVNVSSSAEHHMETKSSLQFAQKVNGCDVGPAARGMPKTPPRR